MVGILITNGGPHPASKLAEMTVDQFIRIGDGATDKQFQAGVALREKMVKVLETHHAKLQVFEREKLKVDRKRLEEELVADEALVETVCKELMKVAQGTEFYDYFIKSEIQDYVRRILAQYFRVSMDIEWSWYADRNPNLPEARLFKERKQGA